MLFTKSVYLFVYLFFSLNVRIDTVITKPVMATIAIVLKTTQKTTNDEYPVALRVTHERQSKYFVLKTLVTNQALKWRCKCSEWKPAQIEDNGLGKFRKNFEFYKECNIVLENKLNEARNLLQRYELERIDFTFKQFEFDLKRKDEVLITTLNDYYTHQIHILEEQKRIGLAGLYRENQSILNKFRSNALLTDVNISFLESFEYWLRNERKNKDTTISVKMRNLQRLINQATDDNLVKRENYPFGEKKYSINKRLDHTTKKIAISLDKINKLRALYLKEDSPIHFAQQIFLFSYFCRGMNFIDITYLKWRDISNTHIIYTRKKTRGKFEIPLNDYSLQILAYYKKQESRQDEFIFPILNPDIHRTLKQQYTRKKTALKAVNYNLKRLADIINEPNLKLTTNVGRHTYATGLKKAGVKTSYISEALGHSTEGQTHTYLDQFEESVIQDFEKALFYLG